MASRAAMCVWARMRRGTWGACPQLETLLLTSGVYSGLTLHGRLFVCNGLACSRLLSSLLPFSQRDASTAEQLTALGKEIDGMLDWLGICLWNCWSVHA